jgi:hypothetical protein
MTHRGSTLPSPTASTASATKSQCETATNLFFSDVGCDLYELADADVNFTDARVDIRGETPLHQLQHRQQRCKPVEESRRRATQQKAGKAVVGRQDSGAGEGTPHTLRHGRTSLHLSFTSACSNTSAAASTYGTRARRRSVIPATIHHREHKTTHTTSDTRRRDVTSDE